VNTTVQRNRDGQPWADVEIECRGTPSSDVEASTDVGAERRMGGSADHTPSPMDTEAVQALVEMARSRRSTMSRFAPEWAYYRGVEAAAEQVLHPELAVVRNIAWLDRHNPGFSPGYLETIALLAPAWRWSSARHGSGALLKG
jgi:hypothetical protein